jgi:phosphatidylserine/phosphatidylglycerophosphate/cardiolipin synthase-like enzyme
MNAVGSVHPPRKSSVWIWLLLCVQVLAGCANTDIPPRQTQETEPDGIYSIYFSRPDDPASASLRGGPDAALADAIRNARISVDVAALDLNLWSLRDALIDAARRGLVVRMVADSDYLDGEEIQELVDAGIPVLGDRRESLLHHKFMLIDRQEVWTGSLNFTVNGAYRNDNNLVRLVSTELAQDYLREFEEMFIDDRFGDHSRADTPFPRVELAGDPLDVRFSPDDGVADFLVELLSQAQERIDVLAYSFTSDPLAEALIAAAERGVVVRAVFDEEQARFNTGGDYERLLAAGLDVRLDGNPGKMHHKVILIDGKLVIFGSYNFSSSAELRNDENLLAWRHPEAAATFQGEFERIYALAHP